MSERFDELSEDIEDKFMEIYKQKAFQFQLNFEFINDSKLKKTIEIKKYPTYITFYWKKKFWC